MSAKFSLAVLAVAAIAVVACGGGSDAEPTPDCRIDADAEFTDSPPRVSLEEARQRSQFGVGLPEELPVGVSLNLVFIQPDPGCPDDRLRGVQLVFSGPGYSFVLEERRRGGNVAGSRPFQINGVEGSVFRRNDDDGRKLVSFSWADQKRGYVAYAFLEGGLTEERFLEILDSIPE